MPRAERRLGYPIREGRRGDRRLRAAMTMLNAIVNIHRGENSVQLEVLFRRPNLLLYDVCRRFGSAPTTDIYGLPAPHKLTRIFSSTIPV